jgi:transcriptional regulator with XRE-family HTH domain
MDACRLPALSPVHAAFGQALRELRAERGVSQEAVALDAGLNRGYYSGVERGVRNVSLTNIVKIAAALGVPASEVLARAERKGGRKAAVSPRSRSRSAAT